ncbi:Signal transduction histidine kinase [Jatrophihabitans endophyticus]|uniref:histidine kinase n=1 Tax=Jatrophihabitans endophyticus TaxID=1206085 RepID=A0A1M5UMW5_9ACTN|nr:histidine kinase [Jatrophihabitans endophyticus]SHH64309.1 Signal transduction histidine kinase [Jatrophihabitans endophyticus]
MDARGPARWRAAAARWLRAVRTLVAAALVDVVGVLLLLALLGSAVLCLVGVGLPLADRAAAGVRGLVDRRRRRAEPPIASPYPPLPVERGPRLRQLVTTPATWRDLAWLALPLRLVAAAGLLVLTYLTVQTLLLSLLWLVLPVERVGSLGMAVTGFGTAALGVVNAVLLGIVAALAPTALLRGDAWLARWLLGASAATRLTARVESLAAARHAAVDASAVELRRIERDLHDGAQARLVAMGMTLGMAESSFDTDPALARALVGDARGEIQTALGELRDLVRGIAPPLLAERGIVGALEAMTHTSSIPVVLDARLGRRLARPVETAAYFTVVEALTNAAKHSGADTIRVTILDRGDALALQVRDDGRGGADPLGGSGLRGVQSRLAPFDGTLRISSPPGGPTVVDVELPCGS